MAVYEKKQAPQDHVCDNLFKKLQKKTKQLII
jgi:hypothetical protein